MPSSSLSSCYHKTHCCFVAIFIAAAAAAVDICLQPSLLSANYDPFFRQKGAALTKSMAAAADIAATLQQLLQQQQAAVAAAGGDKQQQLEAHLGAEAKDRMYQLFQVNGGAC